MNGKTLRKTILTGLFIALGIILPFFTGRMQMTGQMFLPMHIPVILCGIICGWQYGIISGFLTPLLNYLILFGPPLPVAAAMMFELAVYGCLMGIFYKIFKNKFAFLCVSLIVTLIAGRIVSIAANYIISLMGFIGFDLGGMVKLLTVTALPGIIIQMVFIPSVILYLQKSNLMVTLYSADK